MNKVIRHVFPAGEEGFDPAAAHDLYSGTVEQVIFETLLTYDYLARPAKLVPLTAEALPQITDNGQTYTFKIKKGIYFTPDPGVQGREARARRRRLRLFAEAPDGSRRSARRGRGSLDGKIVGLDELADEGEEDRQVRLRREGRRASRRSTATRCASG